MGGASGASQAGPLPPTPTPTHGRPCSPSAGPGAGPPRHLRTSEGSQGSGGRLASETSGPVSGAQPTAQPHPPAGSGEAAHQLRGGRRENGERAKHRHVVRGPCVSLRPRGVNGNQMWRWLQVRQRPPRPDAAARGHPADSRPETRLGMRTAQEPVPTARSTGRPQQSGRHAPGQGTPRAPQGGPDTPPSSTTDCSGHGRLAAPARGCFCREPHPQVVSAGNPPRGSAGGRARATRQGPEPSRGAFPSPGRSPTEAATSPRPQRPLPASPATFSSVNHGGREALKVRTALLHPHGAGPARWPSRREA